MKLHFEPNLRVEAPAIRYGVASSLEELLGRVAATR